MPPSLYRRILHPVLVRTGSERRRRALRGSEAFFPYFSMETRYDDGAARAALRSSRIEAPPLASYFDRLIDYALRAEWGRKRSRAIACWRRRPARLRAAPRGAHPQAADARARAPGASRRLSFAHRGAQRRLELARDIEQRLSDRASRC